MHESYWGLRESPFRSSNHVERFFASPTHKEALARLHFLVQQRRLLGLLSGCDGSGKSLVLNRFRRELGSAGRSTCLANLLGMELHDFLWSLASGLRANPGSRDDTFALWRRIDDRIRENQYQDVRTIVLLDDADKASRGVLTGVLRLLKTHSGRVTAVLAIDATKIARLGSDLLQLAQLRIHLDAWEESDVRQYLQGALYRVAGSSAIFDDSAIRRLQALTDGIPRWVDQLAELSLMVGAADRRDRVDSDVVEAAYQELSAAFDEQPCVALSG
jgi:general secretion pathway protein A